MFCRIYYTLFMYTYICVCLCVLCIRSPHVRRIKRVRIIIKTIIYFINTSCHRGVAVGSGGVVVRPYLYTVVGIRIVFSLLCAYRLKIARSDDGPLTDVSSPYTSYTSYTYIYIYIFTYTTIRSRYRRYMFIT